MVAGNLIQLTDLLAQAGRSLQSRHDGQHVMVFRGGVPPQFRDLDSADDLLGARGDAAGCLALKLSRPGWVTLEFLHILAVRHHCHLEYLGQIGAGAILGFFLRGCLSASDQILRTLILGAVAREPVGCGRRLAGATGQKCEHDCKNGKGSEFHFLLLVVGMIGTQCWVRYVFRALRFNTCGKTLVVNTSSSDPSISTDTS